MKWEDVQKQKLKLTREVVESLDDVERELLKRILQFERDERSVKSPRYKRLYIAQLNSRIPLEEVESE